MKETVVEERRLRLWPGVMIVALQWALRFVLPAVWPEAMLVGVGAGVAGGAAILVWWVFFSRASRLERWGGGALMIGGLAAARPLLDPSIATGGMGFLYYMYAIPTLGLAVVAGALLSRRLAAGPWRLAMVGAVLVGCAGWALVRTGGFTAAGDSDFSWRWAETPEDRLLALAADEPLVPLPAPIEDAVAARETHAEAVDAEISAPGLDRGDPAPTAPLADLSVSEAAAEAPSAPAVPTAPPASDAAADWPGFRGARRDGVVRGPNLRTDWSTTPPQELWRRAVGPGWSSFAIDGGLLYTQEQRGDEEAVSCYRVATGEPVWRHADRTRFWESNAGAGPRGTPTLNGGRVFALGGTGILNALDARDGAVVWSRDAAADTGAETPIWGFAGSPLVVEDLVVVAASGSVAAYDRETGEPRWYGPAGGEGYSSPQLATVDGSVQILQLSGDGLVALAPADGTVLWEHSWKGYPIVQPAVLPGGDILISVNVDSGTRRLAVHGAGGSPAEVELRGAGGVTVEELWTSNGLKPYFNDFVLHEGHAFGFDGSLLAGIDLEDGRRLWKGGRYGNGQLLLLADQDLLLVLSERGEIALVRAIVDGFEEVARFPAIHGKSWSHPALVGDVLLVRNAEEMAAFRLPSQGD